MNTTTARLALICVVDAAHLDEVQKLKEKQREETDTLKKQLLQAEKEQQTEIIKLKMEVGALQCF